MRTDVLVCGGGPGGLAAAIACRLEGLDVAVAECGSPPVDKPCGEGLLPDALESLARLGVDLGCVPGSWFEGIRFVANDATVQAQFAQGRARGVRRTHLHDALCKRADALGVRLLWQTQVLGLTAEPSGVTVQSTAAVINARWCVGADGLNSRVRLWSGLDRAMPASRRIGLRAHFRLPPWSEWMEVYWGRSGQAYVTPITTDEISVAVVGRQRYPSLDAALGEFPALAARLHGVRRSSQERGAATLQRRLPGVTSGPVALLGDASGSIDAVSGAGLGLAFQQALALAPALATGDLGAYEAAHRAITRRPALVARGLLLLDSHAVLRRVTLAGFARMPWLFRNLLAFHTGAWDAGVSRRVDGLSPVIEGR